MKSIGGYLGFELPRQNEYHDQLLRLNTGRNAFEYILKARNYKQVYLPYYCCDALLEPIKKMSITYLFYKIDDNLDPIIDFKISENDCFLYINYFGVKNDTVKKLTEQGINLVIDNSQSFFSRPIGKADTFYSCRKFFGVPDGAYLSIQTTDKLDIKSDMSYDRCSHLLKNIDCGIEEGYKDFLANEDYLSNQDIKQMSVLTQRMMSSLNYVFCKEQRNKNFHFLHEQLREINELKIDFKQVDGPLSYPLLISNSKLRQLMINENVYLPDYWPNVRNWAGNDTYEYFLSGHILALPVDQRYGNDDMDRIVKTIFKLL